MGAQHVCHILASTQLGGTVDQILARSQIKEIVQRSKGIVQHSTAQQGAGGWHREGQLEAATERLIF